MSDVACILRGSGLGEGGVKERWSYLVQGGKNLGLRVKAKIYCTAQLAPSHSVDERRTSLCRRVPLAFLSPLPGSQPARPLRAAK